MKRILTLLILLSITNFYGQTYTHNSKVRVKNTDTSADTDNLVTIDANGLLKRTTQTVDQLLTSAPTLDNVLTAGNTTTQIPIFNGGFNSVFGVISNTTDFSRLSNSLFTVRETSAGTGTTVSQFIDVTRANMDESTTGQVFGLVSRVINTSDETNRGLIGANLVARDNGAGDLEFVYASITQADAQNEGSIDFLAAETLRTNITGSGAYTIDFARGLGSDLVLNNPNANVTNLQAMHPSIQLTNGTVTDVTNLFLDLDWDNTGSTTVTGDIAYIRAGNDALPTPTGNTYFIKSEAPHPSEFAGSITATNFIGNFNGQPASYYDGRNFGLGVTSYDVTTMNLNDTSLASGFYKFNNLATGNPAGSSGSLINLKSGATDYITQFAHFINAGDTKRIFIRHYSPALANWSTWAELVHSQNVNSFVTSNNVLDTSTTDLQTTSTGVNDEVYSFTIPANTLEVGDVLKLRLTGEDTSGNSTPKTIQFQLAGQTINVTNFISTLYTNNQRFIIDAEIIITGLTEFRYSSEMTVQRSISGMNTYGAIFEDDRTTGTFNVANTNNVTIDLNNSTNGYLVIKTVSVKLFKG